MSGFYNNGIIGLLNYRVINNSTVSIPEEDILPGNVNRYYLEGTNIVTLPPIEDDSTYIELIIINGETTITNNVDGVTNQVFKIKNERVLLIRHDLEYSIASIGQVDATNIINSGVKYFFDTANSTTTNLTAGSSFVGAITDITQYPSISFLAFADQNLTITIDQFIDSAGTKPSAGPVVFSYVANEKLGMSFPINGNYIRVTAKNEGGSTTTNLQIDTAYGEIGSTNEIQDDYLRGQATQTATVNNILTPASGTTPTDVTKYRSFTCQVVSTGTGGTFIFEGSNTGVSTEFEPIPVYNQALTVRNSIITAITATNSKIIYEGSCNFKFIRLRIVTTITGGSIQAHTIFMHTPLSTTSQVVSNGTAGNLLATVSGTVTANIGTGSLAAGTNAIGDTGMQYRANATGAASIVAVSSPATPASATIKASAGRLLGWQLTNTSAALRSIKIFNATAPTLGTTSAVFPIDIPAGQTVNFRLEGGIGFSTAMTYSVTSAKGLTDNTATGLAAADVTGAFFFA